MSSLRFSSSNLSSFSNNVPAFIVGKNGFSTELGVIPLYVSSADKTDLDANITFSVRGLSTVFDYNSNTHVLENSNFIGSQQVSFQILMNDPEGEEEDVAYTNPYVTISANILSYDLGNNKIVIDNYSSEGVDLFSKLETTPFYIKLFQPLSPATFNEKFIFVTGTEIKGSKSYNVSGITGQYTANMGITPEDKKFISLYLDEALQGSTTFEWNNGSSITVPLANNYTTLRVKYQKYTVPTIELGDNISVIFNNVHSIVNYTYGMNSNNYNANLTGNNIFGIYLADNLKINATSFVATNISPNPIGQIGNVLQSNNTFTLDYNENLYPGNFYLANQNLYRLVQGNKYTPLNLMEGRTLYNVPTGTISIRARNVNSSGRKSPFVNKTIDVNESVMPGVDHLQVEESLYRDTSQGVAVRATISWDHNSTKNILAYEVSYKIEGETVDLNSFNTVQVPITAVDPIDGRIRYAINNIDRGRATGINYLVVRVTPINNDLRGVTKQIVHKIIGKINPPSNVTAFSFAQNASMITLFWDFLLNSDQTLQDIDLQEVEIRRISGEIDPDNYSSAWGTAAYISTIAIPSTNHNFVIDAYGTYTYLIKTRDTSRIESTDVQGFTVNLQRAPNLSAYKVWSEDDPSANNVVLFMNNKNYAEYYWPSFANSDNGGFSYAVDDPITPGVGPSSLTENANGTSSGFTVSVSLDDLNASSNAFYQTAVRDLGSVLSGKITVTANLSTVLASTWLSMRENLVSGVSSAGSNNTVLWDDGSYIGSILLANGVTYSSENKTLVSNDSYGNVYAIWNSGQFGSDVSNANSFALIAGVINANAIALSRVYSAGGIETLSNVFTNVTTTASSYQLVNLKQWGDPDGLGSWQGPDYIVSYNVQIRYSTDNVFYSANHNVNVMTMTSNGQFNIHNSGDIEFRWFQLKLNIINQNPSLASTVLDKFNYTVDLTDKTYTATVQVNTNPTFVDFSGVGFRTTPIVTLQPIVDSPLRVNNTFPSYSSINSNSTQANITVYSNVGAFVPNTYVNISATGY